jgi:transposase
VLRMQRAVAPFVFDGPINGEAFRVWVKQVLAPALQPGDIVVMDNLGVNRCRQAETNAARLTNTLNAVGANDVDIPGAIRFLPASRE